MNEISDLLFSLFGQPAAMSPVQLDLPLLYASNFTFCKARCSHPLLFIRPNRDSDPSLISGVYAQSKKCDAISIPVFDLAEASQAFIHAVRKANYPYYLHGKLVLSIPASGKRCPPVKQETAYTKTTQVVAKFYFFAPVRSYTVAKIAKATNISTSGASRANIALKELGLLEEVSGSFPSYRRIDAKTYLDKWMNLYVHPIKELFYLRRKDLSFLGKTPFLYAGDTALSNLTSLSPIDYSEIVLSKDDYLKLKANKPEEQEDGNVIAIEQYRYDPFLFSKDKNVDLADLYFLIKRKYNLDEDPRLEQSLLEIESRLFHAES